LKDNNQKHRIAPLLLSVMLIIMGILLASLYCNDGHFFYTLDDPYIHLALAEHIAHGHYGLNEGEFASPSSTILWPFLLVPWVGLSWGYMVPLGINSIACLLTVTLLQRSLQHVYKNQASRLAIATIFLTGSVGVVFTGMEHSLQIVLAVAIVSALIDLTEERPLPGWLEPALILAPLVRYEMLSISLGAIGLLCLHRRYHYLFCAIAIAFLLGGFSYYLWLHTGRLLPDSVIAKLAMDSNPLNVFPMVVAMVLTAGLIIHLRKQSRRLWLCFYMLLVLLAQVLLGKCGWFSRYEVYAFISAVLVLVYYAPIAGGQKLMKRPADTLFVICSVVMVTFMYTWTTISIPAATRDIYSQQVQMRRLLDDSHFDRVAVNDIGYISFHNRDYVLDLWGLGKFEIWNMRNGHKSGWLKIVSDHDINLVMINHDWFLPPIIPENWILMGTLTRKMSPFFLNPLGSSTVDIYATTPAAAKLLTPVIDRWRQGLPSRSIWYPNSKQL